MTVQLQCILVLGNIISCSCPVHRDTSSFLFTRGKEKAMSPCLLTWSLRWALIVLTIYHAFFKFIQSPKFTDLRPLSEGITTERPLTTNLESSRRMATGATDEALSTSKPLCSRAQLQDGEWHKITLDKPPYVPPHSRKFLCSPVEMYKQDSFDTHECRPRDKTCDFLRWDTDQFCDLMRQQTILFMGDSLTQEAMYAFSELLGLRTSPDESRGNPVYDFASACNNTVNAVYRREDFLRPSKVAWELKARSPTIAVLNRGAHYVNDTELLQDMNETIQHIKEWQSNCTSMGRRCLLIWRTTVPGHPKCLDFSHPVTNQTEMERLVDDHPISRRYHWHEFRNQNELIEQALTDSGVDFEILDAYHINILRPDKHRAHTYDCLHSCLDSKLDVYSQVILHLLRKHQAMTQTELTVRPLIS